MFFRTKKIKNTPLVQLVESYRNEEGQPRQRVVVSLGNVDIPREERKAIARAVELRLEGQSELFDSELSEESAKWVSHIVKRAEHSKSSRPAEQPDIINGVIADKVETENVVQLGPELVALQAWKELGFSEVLKGSGFTPGAISTAQLMISNRLIEPLSEWALIDWAERTALPELLDISITKQNKDKLYRTSDKLVDARKNIEKSLSAREKDLFSLKRSIILYDVTNTHFEGVCAANPKAKHGKNKQKRNDCRQIAIGMAFDEFGFSLGHDIFEGNMADTSTLTTMLESLDRNNDGSKPVVILDAGFASAGNLDLLKKRGYSYLINITRSQREKYAEFFEKEEFVKLPGRSNEKMVEVKTIKDPDDVDQQLVLCRSAQRRLKEEAMISQAEARFMSDAEALKKRIEKGQLKSEKPIERKIGALKNKHPRVSRFFSLEHKNCSLDIIRDDEKMRKKIDRCGEYVLKTDQTYDAATLWELYMTLLKAESGFRMLKGSLGLRPNFHQKESRVDGHVFISVLAYHLLSWIRWKLEKAGDHREWYTIRRLLSTHSLVTTRLPLKDGRIISIRKASNPDAEQARVYSMLGIDWKKVFKPLKTEIRP